MFRELKGMGVDASRSWSVPEMQEKLVHLRAEKDVDRMIGSTSKRKKDEGGDKGSDQGQDPKEEPGPQTLDTQTDKLLSVVKRLGSDMGAFIGREIGREVLRVISKNQELRKAMKKAGTVRPSGSAAARRPRRRSR
jgi:hypothetical protein